MPVGVLDSYVAYAGDIVSLVYSSWTYRENEYVQVLELPSGSDVMRLRFKLFAKSGDEIFLRFHYLEHPEDWFYVFTSADLRVKKMFKPRDGLDGENEYPAVGGLLINNKEQLPLQILPKFPLGVGMVEDLAFQLQLHRNPQNDDGLGLGGALEDPYPVEHDFLISMNDLDFTSLWRNHILHKHGPIVFGVMGDPSRISLDLSLQKTWFEEWQTETEYSLGEGDPCVYLSSIGVRQGKKYAKVLNICDTAQTFHLDGYEVGEEVLINENPIPQNRNQITVDGKEISWDMNENSGESVVRYPIDFQEGKISPFSFTAYEVSQRTSWYTYFFGNKKR